jgi:peptidoglycan/xylan/chitin deacetylase (PgdA/CDA1 family)
MWARNTVLQVRGYTVKSRLPKFLVNTLGTVLGLNGQQRLSVLIYHRVLPEHDYMRIDEPTIEEFGWQMQLISRYFRPLSIRKALEKLNSGTLPDRAICVTFDDGYADNALCALPVLEKWSVPATVFVSTGFLDGGIMWNDLVIESFRNQSPGNVDLTKYGLGSFFLDSNESRYAGAQKVLGLIKHLEPELREEIVRFLSVHLDKIPDELMLTSSQVFHLSRRGIEIGAHTHTHPILTSLQSGDARREIEVSKEKLESIVDRSIDYFAYPNGRPGQDYNPVHTSIVEDLGFEAGFTTSPGVSNSSTDRYQLPRFTPWDKSPEKFLTRLLWNARSPVKNTDAQSS